MRGNEILLILKNEGYEKGVRNILLRMAEEQQDFDRTFKEFAKTFDALVRVQSMLNGALDGMDAKIKAMGKQDDDPRATREMIS